MQRSFALGWEEGGGGGGGTACNTKPSFCQLFHLAGQDVLNKLSAFQGALLQSDLDVEEARLRAGRPVRESFEFEAVRVEMPRAQKYAQVRSSGSS